MGEEARFCPACGSPSEDPKTTTSPARQEKPPSSASRPSRRIDPKAGRFVPGALLGERYRIVALLGRGGMGEVYRAQDLTLGQDVALKFLPESAKNEETLGRFRQEVRIARSVSHPNVCRVYDIGEEDGQPFLSMEYVDGENLSALLKRIGRFSPERALEVARKICAGLAAAHLKGILHRDLKPANIMLDSRGEILIMDFGLASLAGEVAAGDVQSGTPAYMAPEQLSGKEVTARSDIYALGLILYELFTGKRAYEGRGFAEVLRERAESTPSTPSSVVKDLDPVVERVILRCLESDPAARPASALAVSAALPGGDPLAAALAAGETPSPQVVANAGATVGLGRGAALLTLGLAVLGLALTLVPLSFRTNATDRLGLLAPEVLLEKTRDLLQRLGYEAAPRDQASALSYDFDFMRNLDSRKDLDAAAWDKIFAGRPTLGIFWYRSSLDTLVTFDFHDDLMTPGEITFSDPPTTQAGMINLSLDARGRLRSLLVLPPEKDEAPQKGTGEPWDALFAAAELDPSTFAKADPVWTSLAASDSRAAWMGHWPGTSDPLRVEAASFHGKPVFFALVSPWTRPGRTPQPTGPGARTSEITLLIVATLVLGGAVFLAYRNHSRGKGDQAGALRLGIAVFCAQLALFFCRVHLAPDLSIFGLGLVAIGNGLFLSVITFVLYLSLEPYVRKHWPQTIIAWSRILAGRVRDPLVGRDVLYGVILGVAWVLSFQVVFLILVRLGASPDVSTLEYLQGFRAALGTWIVHFLGSIRTTLTFFFVFLFLRILVRPRWLGSAIGIALFTLLQASNHPHLELYIPQQVLIYAIAYFALVRFGLVTLATGVFVADLLLSVPYTFHASAWYAPPMEAVLVLVLAMAFWGFYTSLGDQRLFRAEVFDD
jgi:serine/threonine-protein kinase